MFYEVVVCKVVSYLLWILVFGIVVKMIFVLDIFFIKIWNFL